MKRLLLLPLTTLPLLGGDPKATLPDRGGWEFSLSAGPSYRRLGTLKINSGYRSTPGIVPSFVGGDSLTTPPVGDPDQVAERFYNDGYVRADAGTAIDGSTWFWGYQEAAQVQGDQLVFTATGQQSVFNDGFTAPRAGPSSRDSLRGVAPHLQFDARSPYEVGGFRLGFSAGFDLLEVDQSLRFSNLKGSQQREDFRLDYEDRYDLDGVIPPLAPYNGTFDGPGPLIGNLPTSRSITPVLIGTTNATIANQVRGEIEILATSFTVGPTLSRRWGDFDLSLQGGLILNFLHWEASQYETLAATTATGSTEIARWADGDSGTKFRPGLYAQCDALYHIDEEFSIGAYLRLETAREFRAQAGPTVFRVDPSGFSTGLHLRYTLP